MRLNRVTPREDEGFTRVACGTGYRLQRADGRPVPTAARSRAESLVLPPAWTQVWISADPRGHIQAVGVDAAGRQQYVYHPDWVRHRDRDKYARSLALAADLPGARARVTRALRGEGLGRGRVLAAAFRLLDDSAVRIGSEEYLNRYGTRGLTTLRCQDLVLDDTSITLQFVGKGGARIQRRLKDPDVAAVVEELARSRPRGRLFAFQRDGHRVPLRAADVNEYIQQNTSDDITAKDFRTLHGTIVAARSLARTGPAGTARDRRLAQREAVAEAARFLGNTPTVARRSYIDPRVFTRYEQGETLDLRRSAEGALRSLLG